MKNNYLASLSIVCLLLVNASLTFKQNTRDQIKNTEWPEENYHGLLNISEKNSQSKKDVFYWFFPSRRSRDSDPLAIWLSGGPGCSSELAIFIENGPFTLDPETIQIRKNPFSWNNQMNLIYIDQPLGTGFSDPSIPISEMLTNEDQIKHELYTVIIKFLDLYPEFKGRDFYILGESYAGHYIPHLGNYIFHQKNPDLPLKGLAMGNSMPNPWVQFESIPKYALEHGMIDVQKYQEYTKGFQHCENMMKYGQSGGFMTCMVLMSQMLVKITPEGQVKQRFNQYNITKKAHTIEGYDFGYLEKFMNSKAVQNYQNIRKEKWVECNTDIYMVMTKDWTENAAPQLKDLLENGVKVLAYHGDLDWICNWIGGKYWTESVPWNGHDGYMKAEFENIGYGLMRSYGKLMFIKFFNSGHMVPMDQPENSLKMIIDFVQR